MVRLNSQGSDHPVLHKSRLLKDEESIKYVKETIDNWTKLFDYNSDLMNIATGTFASKEVADDLRDAHKKGETEYLTFKKERLECDEPT